MPTTLIDEEEDVGVIAPQRPPPLSAATASPSTSSLPPLSPQPPIRPRGVDEGQKVGEDLQQPPKEESSPELKRARTEADTVGRLSSSSLEPNSNKTVTTFQQRGGDGLQKLALLRFGQGPVRAVVSGADTSCSPPGTLRRSPSAASPSSLSTPPPLTNNTISRSASQAVAGESPLPRPPTNSNSDNNIISSTTVVAAASSPSSKVATPSAAPPTAASSQSPVAVAKPAASNTPTTGIAGEAPKKKQSSLMSFFSKMQAPKTSSPPTAE